jgi:hypothetical protein
MSLYNFVNSVTKYQEGQKNDTLTMRISRRNYEKIANAGNAADTLDDALTRLLDCSCKSQDNDKQ